ncbi:inositol monophosphatase family protein [Quadrisphaera sp. GCM10027208]|uniref:inositol monophosphatase family protein n=1 Tax=Quadrisphaera sp. GCM10027208 TaxID=3273423 RepID=UPI00361E9659
MTSDAVEVRALAGLAERAARAAGDLVRQRPASVTVAATKSSPTDVVTEMDTAAEARLTEVLLGERPDDGLLGEESGLRAGSSGVTWVVDPIDGTVNYLYGIPAYAVSVAAVTGDPDPARWRQLAACVHNPVTGETWTAALGQGAALDGAPVRVTQGVRLDRALVGTGFGYTVERRREQARVVADLLPRIRDVRRAGAASLDLCSVACGRLDAYYEQGLRPWDLAAGGLVAAEAGALVTGTDGRPAGEAMVVAGSPPLARALVAELERLGAGRVTR